MHQGQYTEPYVSKKLFACQDRGFLDLNLDNLENLCPGMRIIFWKHKAMYTALVDMVHTGV